MTNLLEPVVDPPKFQAFLKEQPMPTATSLPLPLSTPCYDCGLGHFSLLGSLGVALVALAFVWSFICCARF